MDFSFLAGLFPVLISSAAPFLTEAVKRTVSIAGARIPRSFKPVVNIAAGAILGGLSGDVVAGTTVGAATSMAFAVGKNS